ncbi:MAG: hypothetical protein EOO45_03960 [Flavobacterium sp.]|nr:MAG: hypothetical protein EOO45_03960 [Flavobacterium sp.]
MNEYKREQKFKNLGILGGANLILMLLFITGMLLLIPGIEIYRKTIIPLSILVLLVTLATAIGAGVFLFFFSSQKLWYLFGVSAAFFGGMAFFLTLYLNRQTIDDQGIVEDFDIVHRSTMPRSSRSSSGCRQPLININFYGQEKELVFFCQHEDLSKRARKVKLNYSKGAFGYAYIISQKLME